MAKRDRASVLKSRARKASTATRAAKRHFDAAHEAGMAALKRRDYGALADAIERERLAIDSVPAPKMRKTKKRS